MLGMLTVKLYLLSKPVTPITKGIGPCGRKLRQR